MKEVIENLRDDEQYYGDFGRQYMSNSDIKTLLTNPREYGIQRPDSVPFMEGRYFHTALLEPMKQQDIPVVDASTRNTKIYKDYLKDNNLELALLEKEIQAMDYLIKTIKGNAKVMDMVWGDDNLFEEPMVGEILGKNFKGKADVVTPDYLIDLKTTSDISRFKWSARDYGYDSQAYIYSQLFGKPLMFIVICKKTHNIGTFYTSEEFIARGKEKVERALRVYDKFFGESALADVEDWIIEDEL